MSPSRARFVHRVDVFLRDTEAVDRTRGLAPGTETRVAQAVPCLVCVKPGRRREGYGQEFQERRIRVLFPDPIDLSQRHRLAFTDSLGRARSLLVDSFRDDTDRGYVYVAECQDEPV